MDSQGSSACQGPMESEACLVFLARGARWVGRGFLETLGKEVLLDWMETLENWACQGPEESPASLATWEHWVRLAIQDPRA